MKSSLRTAAFLLLTLALVGVQAVEAQSSRRLAATPKSFQTFYLKFKAAVVRRDRKAVATLTRFPFKYGWDAGDEGTYTRAQFVANFTHIFGDGTRLFRQKNPTFYTGSQSFTLTNNENASHYTFEKRGSTYVFAAFIVEP